MRRPAARRGIPLVVVLLLLHQSFMPRAAAETPSSPTQLKFEIHIAAARAGGNPYEIGLGGGIFGLKFNFYNDQNRGLRISIYPQLEFATPGSAEKDLAEKGQTIVVPVLVSKESKFM